MDQRKTVRFELELPLAVVRMGKRTVYDVARTRNISSHGVFFESGRPFETGEALEYVVTLTTAPDIYLYCHGRVLSTKRDLQPGASKVEYKIAASVDRYELFRSEESLRDVCFLAEWPACTRPAMNADPPFQRGTAAGLVHIFQGLQARGFTSNGQVATDSVGGAGFFGDRRQIRAEILS